jgi:hypothetical protein
MVSRRRFLKLAGLGTGAALLGGCIPALTPTSQQSDLLPSPAPFTTPVDTSTPRILSPTPDARTPQSPTPAPTGTPSTTPTDGPAPASQWTPGAGSQYFGINLCFVLWDHQLARYHYQPRNIYTPVPETVPLFSGASNLLTYGWIAYWRGILRVCNPGMTAGEFEDGWSKLVQSDRAFTNGTGPETNIFAIHSLTCGGATHAMTTSMAENGYMRINTLNWHMGPPPIPGNPDQIDMTRHFFATTGTNIKLPDGSYVVNGFPQFENCIVPLISQNDTDLIALSRIKAVRGIQRPYNP